ncbi:MAG: HNH endonuclease, partial [Clostridium sp.]
GDEVAAVTDINHKNYEDGIDVYNLEVEGSENYLISEFGARVKSKCSPELNIDASGQSYKIIKRSSNGSIVTVEVNGVKKKLLIPVDIDSSTGNIIRDSDGNPIRTYDINQFKNKLKAVGNNPTLSKKFANENGFDNIDQMLKQYDLINKYIDESGSSRIIRADLSGDGRYNIFGNPVFKEGTESLIKLSMKNPAITDGDIYSGANQGTFALNNKIQFKALWKKVYELYTTNPDGLKKSNEDLYNLLKAQDKEVIDGMASGDGIKKYTWHHSHKPGEFQLLDSDFHNDFRHTGGDKFWGGAKNLEDLDPSFDIKDYKHILFN